MQAPRPHSRKAPWAVLTVLVAATLLSFAPTATAHGGNHGTVKVHDDESAEPDVRNEPHVSCDFWIEGFNMHDDEGSLVFYGWPPTGDKSVVVPTGDDLEWSGDLEDDKDGYHFLKGPYQLPAGHYRVEAFSNGGHPGDHDHFSKTKTFWVDPCEQKPPTECPGDLDAEALEGGSILVTFTHANGSNGTNIYRAAGAGDLEYVTTIGSGENGTYLDTNTTIGTSYTYLATALFGDSESRKCPAVEVTSIPVFPSALAAGLAAIVGGLAYVGMRRRG